MSSDEHRTLSPVRRLDPGPTAGIELNDDDPSLARRSQRRFVEAVVAGLVSDRKRRRLGKKQGAVTTLQGAQAEYHEQSGEYGCCRKKRHQPLKEHRPIGIGVKGAKAQLLEDIAQEKLELGVKQDRKKAPHDQRKQDIAPLH